MPLVREHVRGYGAIRVSEQDAAHDAEHHHIGVLLGTIGSLPSSVDHTPLLDRVLDQGPTNSCVAHWFTTAIYLAGQANGKPVPRPSVRWSYTVARYTDQPGAALVDLGSSARLMCLGSQTHGIVADTRLPFDPSQIDEPPPFDADLAGADALFTGYYRADAVAEQLQSALAQGHFPGIAIDVYSNFESWGATPAAYDQPSGDFKGRHMLTLVGYRTEADDVADFLVLNSWGLGWGNGGLCWMSSAFIESVNVFDRYIVTAAPSSR